MATTQQQNSFIAEIAPIIVKYSKQYGYKVASVTIAQACIESAYGNNWSRKYNNYFGIKYGSWVKRTSIASEISVVNAKTKEEYRVGYLTTIVDGFCKCPTMEIGVQLYFEFLRVNSRYRDLINCTTPLQMAQGLKNAGYATSSKYVNTIMTYVNRHNLTQYDSQISIAQATTKVEGTPVNQYAAIVNVSDFLYVRTGPGTTYPKATVGNSEFHLPKGMVVSIERESNGWGKLTNVDMWVSLQYLKR